MVLYPQLLVPILLAAVLVVLAGSIWALKNLG